MSIEECELRKIEEQAEETRGNEEALESGASGASGADGDESAGGDQYTLEIQNAELVNAMANEINASMNDVIKEKVEAVGDALMQTVGPPDSAAESDGSDPAELMAEVQEFDLTNEKDSYLSCPTNMTRSTGINPAVSISLFRTKFACDINFALICDEYLAKCVSKKVCDAATIKGLKLD